MHAPRFSVREKQRNTANGNAVSVTGAQDEAFI